jgi:hypothetical protein
LHDVSWIFHEQNPKTSRQIMKTFLSTFASLAAAFATTQAHANVSNISMAPSPATLASGGASSALSLEQVLRHEPTLSFTSPEGEAFEFVLERAKDTGLLMARHHSHRSHASHRSHYSSRY